jgi:hypothetical protein
MTNDVVGRIGILWRGDRDARNNATAENNRLRPLFEALATLKVAAEPVVFADDIVDEVRDQLRQLDGVLVWVDPIMGDHDRSRLDTLLREVSSAGVWVSAHPDVILKMGTKEVLFQTRDLGWGADTYLYKTVEEFKRDFPSRLASAGPRVLKQNRGNGGIGVWKVELAANGSVPSVGDGSPVASREDAIVRVQHARPRDTVTEELRLVDFMERCEQYFAGTGRMVDQPFQQRIAEGMIRCYLVQTEIVGFAHQSAEGLTPESSESDAPPARSSGAGAPQGSSSRNILGLPAQKTMYGASEPRFKSLRNRVESDWVPAMRRLVEVDTDSLPLLWDADFLYGPKTEAGEDTYVLCEINVSSVYPFPEPAVGKLAQAVVARVTSAKKIDSAHLA